MQEFYDEKCLTLVYSGNIIYVSFSGWKGGVLYGILHIMLHCPVITSNCSGKINRIYNEKKVEVYSTLFSSALNVLFT